jgi:hypothetical protein
MRGSEQESGAESPRSPPPRREWLGRAWERANAAATRLAVHVGGVVGLYFTVEFAFLHDASPTGLSNVAFAITATLAALCFSYARNLESRPDLQAQAVAAGERLLRGAILMILASLLQYADLYAQAPVAPGDQLWIVGLGWAQTAAVAVLHLAAVGLFLLAVCSIYLGLRSIVDVLLHRADRAGEVGRAP